MAVKVGRLGKVVLGTYTIAEQGTWSMDGIIQDTVEVTKFGDQFKFYEFGLGDGGTITFSGHYDMTDTNGQLLLDSAIRNKSAITNLKLYIDNTSYYTTDNTTTVSRLIMQKVGAIAFDKAGVGTINFSAKVSGVMVLV